jgi:hypothetical protein
LGKHPCFGGCEAGEINLAAVSRAVPSGTALLFLGRFALAPNLFHDALHEFFRAVQVFEHLLQIDSGLRWIPVAAAIYPMLSGEHERVREHVQRDGKTAAGGAHHQFVFFKLVAFVVEDCHANLEPQRTRRNTKEHNDFGKSAIQYPCDSVLKKYGVEIDQKPQFDDDSIIYDHVDSISGFQSHTVVHNGEGNLLLNVVSAFPQLVNKADFDRYSLTSQVQAIGVLETHNPKSLGSKH